MVHIRRAPPLAAESKGSFLHQVEKKMGQIVKRKKKGRPSKADLARRGSSPSSEAQSELRRSHRRRSVRYNFDFDDYLDEDFYEEHEEEERRREKKLKLILKLNQGQEDEDPPSPPLSRDRGIISTSVSAARGRRTMKEEVVEEEEEEDEEEEEESERRKRKIKKRRINSCDEVQDDDEDDEEQQVVDNDEDDDVDAEVRGRKGESKGHDSVPGTPSDPPLPVPIPDTKTLELILDKLQKKDTYGVYAEPVDPEELPDYHDVIEHPMDFATVRKKLGNGSYSTLEQFESDVFLICSNALQYNASDTIYHKQARNIQELATKKFEKLRINVERSAKDSKIEQKTKSNFSAKKQMKKPLHLTTQEHVHSDFSSVAILATAGDIPNSSIAIQSNACERPSHTDVLIDGNSSVADYSLEKTEELSSGKGLLSKSGRKSTTLDDNRRATYNISNQPVVRSDSIFTTFEAEIKQLVAVGLQAEFSYARSLARFAATLGPVAWKVASRRIEQALPVGCKFGRGWVGEYEPLPTPVLTFESRAPKESALFSNLQRTADVRKDDASYKTPVPAIDVRKDVATNKTTVPAKPHPLDVPVSEGKSSSFRPANGSTSEGRSSLFAVVGPKPGKPVNTIHQQQNLPPRFAESENKVSKHVELNLSSTTNQSRADLIAEKNSSNKSEKLASKSKEMTSRNMSSAPAVPPKHNENNVAVDRGFPNGKDSSSCLNNRIINPSAEGISTQMAKVAAYFSQGQEQGISDPVHLMKIFAEKAQKQQSSSNQFPADTPPAIPSIPPIRREESNNAAATAARAWMSIGAGAFKEAVENSGTLKGKISAESLYNPARELHPQASQVRGQFLFSTGMHFQPQPENNSFPFHGFPPRMMNDAHFQNRPMVFPQVVATDLSRFQVQPNWHGFSPRAQPRQKQDLLPPDLNIGFQSPGSPMKQSSGVLVDSQQPSVLVDSQQPDLALQL